MSKLPEDAILATKVLRHLRDQHYQACGYTYQQVTRFLVEALAIQVHLEAGDAMANIVEMAALCRELLIWDMSSLDTSRAFKLLSLALVSKDHWHMPATDQALDKIIECLRAAGPHPLFGREALSSQVVSAFVIGGLG